MKTYPRPDFTEEPIEVVTYHIKDSDGKVTNADHTIFTNYPPDIGVKKGWFDNWKVYMMIADFEFFRRYPNHDRTKLFMTNCPYTKEQMLGMITGKIHLQIGD